MKAIVYKAVFEGTVRLVPVEEDQVEVAKEVFPGAKEVALISLEQIDTLRDLLTETKTDRKKFCAYYNVTALEEMPANLFSNAKVMLEKKKKAA